MKKSVKLILLSAIGAVSIFSTIISSCSSDKCKAVSCANGGICDDKGGCVCAPGFEGSMCEVTTRDKYTGTWHVDESGTISHRDQYVVAIEHSMATGASMAEVQITNLNNSVNGRVNATVKGDTLIIPQQVIDGKTVEGTGFLQNDSYYGVHGALTLKYRITYNDVGDVNDFGFVIGQASQWHK
jgi:hypothetical protein